MTAAVREKLVAPNRAVNDLVDIVARFGLSKISGSGVFEFASGLLVLGKASSSPRPSVCFRWALTFDKHRSSHFTQFLRIPLGLR